jgi:hypothetical protein
MGWIRVSDDFYDHRKFTDAGPLGVALWLAAMGYCNRNLTDGYLLKSKVRGLLDFQGLYAESLLQAGEIIEDTEPYAATSLVICGLWHEDGHDCPSCPQPGPKSYYVHDYLEYQPSRAEVEETRAKRAEAGRKGGKAKQDAKQVARHDAKQTASNVSSKTGSQIEPQSQVPIPSPNPLPNPSQHSDADQSVPYVVGPNGTDLTSVARFLKFDPAAVRAELQVVMPDITDEEVARVATVVLSKAPRAVRAPTQYIISAIHNDEYAIEDIAYGLDEETA